MSQTPRQRRRAKNRTQILNVAEELILSNGFENVSLREIARHSDYSPAALYKYFESKAAIMQAVLARKNLRLVEQLERLGSGISPGRRLVELCLAYIRFNLSNPVYGLLMNNLHSGRTAPGQPIPTNSPFLIFMQAVGEWVSAENIQLPSGYGLEEITYSLWAQTHGMAMLQLTQLEGYPADFGKVDQLTLELYLEGLRGRS